MKIVVLALEDILDVSDAFPSVPLPIVVFMNRRWRIDTSFLCMN